MRKTLTFSTSSSGCSLRFVPSMTAWQTQREWAARGLGGQAAPRWGLPRLCTEAWSPPSRCWHSDGACSSPATWPPGQGAWNPGASSPLSPPVLSQLRGGGAGGWDPPQPLPGWGMAGRGCRVGAGPRWQDPGLLVGGQRSSGRRARGRGARCVDREREHRLSPHPS